VSGSLSASLTRLDEGVGRLPPHSVVATGAFKNFNTIEDFKAADKTSLFNQASEEVSQHP
jgi:hypothetical protein